MRTLLLKFVLFAIAFTMYGCCRIDECEEPTGYFKIRLMRDGKNALYGPDAILTKSSIHLTTVNSLPGQEDYIAFNDAAETIEFSVHEYTSSFLKLSSIRTDTFTITTDFIDTNKSCSCVDYMVTTVSRNGVVLCTGLCEDVIDIEI